MVDEISQAEQQLADAQKQIEQQKQNIQNQRDQLTAIRSNILTPAKRPPYNLSYQAREQQRQVLQEQLPTAENELSKYESDTLAPAEAQITGQQKYLSDYLYGYNQGSRGKFVWFANPAQQAGYQVGREEYDTFPDKVAKLKYVQGINALKNIGINPVTENGVVVGFNDNKAMKSFPIDSFGQVLNQYHTAKDFDTLYKAGVLSRDDINVLSGNINNVSKIMTATLVNTDAPKLSPITTSVIANNDKNFFKKLTGAESYSYQKPGWFQNLFGSVASGLTGFEQKLVGRTSSNTVGNPSLPDSLSNLLIGINKQKNQKYGYQTSGTSIDFPLVNKTQSETKKIKSIPAIKLPKINLPIFTQNDYNSFSSNYNPEPVPMPAESSSFSSEEKSVNKNAGSGGSVIDKINNFLTFNKKVYSTKYTSSPAEVIQVKNAGTIPEYKGPKTIESYSDIAKAMADPGFLGVADSLLLVKWLEANYGTVVGDKIYADILNRATSYSDVTSYIQQRYPSIFTMINNPTPNNRVQLQNIRQWVSSQLGPTEEQNVYNKILTRVQNDKNEINTQGVTGVNLQDSGNKLIFSPPAKYDYSKEVYHPPVPESVKNYSENIVTLPNGIQLLPPNYPITGNTVLESSNNNKLSSFLSSAGQEVGSGAKLAYSYLVEKPVLGSEKFLSSALSDIGIKVGNPIETGLGTLATGPFGGYLGGMKMSTQTFNELKKSGGDNLKSFLSNPAINLKLASKIYQDNKFYEDNIDYVNTITNKLNQLNDDYNNGKISYNSYKSASDTIQSDSIYKKFNNAGYTSIPEKIYSATNKPNVPGYVRALGQSMPAAGSALSFLTPAGYVSIAETGFKGTRQISEGRTTSGLMNFGSAGLNLWLMGRANTFVPKNGEASFISRLTGYGLRTVPVLAAGAASGYNIYKETNDIWSGAGAAAGTVTPFLAFDVAKYVSKTPKMNIVTESKPRLNEKEITKEGKEVTEKTNLETKGENKMISEITATSVDNGLLFSVPYDTNSQQPFASPGTRVIVEPPQWKQDISTIFKRIGIDYTPKPTYAGDIYGGSLLYENQAGKIYQFEYTRNQAVKGYKKAFRYLKDQGLTDYQATKYLRRTIPKRVLAKIDGKILANLKVTDKSSSLTAYMTGTQKTIPIRGKRVNTVKVGKQKYSFTSRTGGKTSEKPIAETLTEIPKLQKKNGITELNKEADITEFLYKGTKNIGKKTEATQYKIRPKSSTTIYRDIYGNPVKESEIFNKVSVVTQSSVSQMVNGLTGKPSKEIYMAPKSKNVIKTSGPYQKVKIVNPKVKIMKPEGIANRLYGFELIPMEAENAKVLSTAGIDLTGYKFKSSKLINEVKEPVSVVREVSKKGVNRLTVSSSKTGAVKSYQTIEKNNLLFLRKLGAFDKIVTQSKAARITDNVKYKVSEIDGKVEDFRKELQSPRITADRARTIETNLQILSIQKNNLVTLLSNRQNYWSMNKITERTSMVPVSRPSAISSSVSKSSAAVTSTSKLDLYLMPRIKTNVKSEVQPKVEVQPRVTLTPRIELQPKVKVEVQPKVKARVEVIPKIELLPRTELTPRILPPPIITPRRTRVGGFGGLLFGGTNAKPRKVISKKGEYKRRPTETQKVFNLLPGKTPTSRLTGFEVSR